jgi:uncharacterized protein
VTSTWVIAGASGVVGRYVVKRLLAAGANLRLFSMSGRPHPDARVQVIRWDPEALSADPSSDLAPLIDALSGADVVLNLSGHSLGSGRLGRRHRHKVLQSRLDSTGVLVSAWQRAENRPQRWLQASAIGYYGDTGSRWVAEEDACGSLYLSDVCRQWEQRVQPVRDSGCPTSLLRFGLILAPDAPAVVRMLRPIRMGLGGRLGSGEQYWSWVTAEDVAAAIVHLADIEHAGPINLVAPGAVTQIDFTRSVAQLLKRPAFLNTPAAALRLAAGGAVDELVLPSCRARADALVATGFEFVHADLDTALPWMLR